MERSYLFALWSGCRRCGKQVQPRSSFSFPGDVSTRTNKITIREILNRRCRYILIAGNRVHCEELISNRRFGLLNYVPVALTSLRDPTGKKEREIREFVAVRT